MEIVCHKGANHVAPENTYAAAEAALNQGASWVEADVWTSRDGEGRAGQVRRRFVVPFSIRWGAHPCAA